MTSRQGIILLASILSDHFCQVNPSFINSLSDYCEPQTSLAEESDVISPGHSPAHDNLDIRECGLKLRIETCIHSGKHSVMGDFCHYRPAHKATEGIQDIGHGRF